MSHEYACSVLREQAFRLRELSRRDGVTATELEAYARLVRECDAAVRALSKTPPGKQSNRFDSGPVRVHPRQIPLFGSSGQECPK